ncbi:hypothetical protein PG999_009517 [Apiospora kogelbergensis]|uniref:Uncharacterized protein n=1 Tax=Apiospora kogelbergensis TaxID=1337665 RepID=A0AAW0QLG2_9PEZI
MPSSHHDSPFESIPSPPMAASAFKAQKGRYSLAEGTPLAQSEITLPYRRSAPSAASLYASTLSPPGSRSSSPIGRPASRIASGSIFGGHGNNALALVDGAGDSPGDPLNIILKAFVPNVAVYASEDTNLLLREKGFEHGLWEILRPFGDRVAGKVIIRDSNGLSRTYEDYSVHFVRYGEGIEHPEPMNSNLKSSVQAEKTGGASEKNSGSERNRRRGGNDADVEAVVERHLSYAEESFGISPQLMDPKQGLDTETPSPYYSLYLRRLLSGLPLVPYETFAHPVACVIAISSRNPSPIETLRRLYNDTSAGEKRLPSWVDSEYLRYYVLVHDEEKDDITKSMSLFEQMKRNLGLHCHLLRIRGTQSAATDDDSIPLPTSEWMSAAEELANLRKHDSQEDFEDPTRYIYESDATAIRTFIREMVTQSIVPTMERHVSVWNDQVASKRKGVTGRIMGLTRRWGFGNTSKSSSGGPGSGTNYDMLGFYQQDSPEAIMRKLADYSFMLRDFKLAYSTYDILRNDFHGDKAWKYHAATNEMAAISLLIMPQSISSKTRTEATDTLFEAAFYSYLTRCTAPYGAIRCLTLGLELLRLRGGSGIDEAAKWGTRLLESRIAGPIGDALIKERLAVCYASKKGMGTHAWGSRRRKSAMWSILSAETWLVQAKYIQAQRCLNEARKMYGDLPNDQGQGIDHFAEASAFMLEIGRQLNHHLESNDQRDDSSDDEASEPVDEESEVMNERGRRISTLGLPGATAATLEAAPLRSQTTDEDDDVDSGKPNDDFG